jgi:hypothetical protein
VQRGRAASFDTTPPALGGAAAASVTAQPRAPFPLAPNLPARADFTGYWALAKHEQLDEFLRAAGFPWVVRKAAVKFGGSSIDVIAHTGSTLRVTSLNAKGSWTRTYDVDREVTQKNAEGTLCKTTSWWEGEWRCLQCHPTAAAASCPALQPSTPLHLPICFLPAPPLLLPPAPQAACSAAGWRAQSWGCWSRGATCAAPAWRCAPRCAPLAAAQRQ